MQQPNQKASKTIIEAMMPSAWATYKQSLLSSVIGFIRVMFAFRGYNSEGVLEKKYGAVTVIVVESISVLVSLFKIITSLVMVVIAVCAFMVSPIINLVMLPFYRRKSVKELTKFIDEQEAEIAANKKRAEEALGGAA